MHDYTRVMKKTRPTDENLRRFGVKLLMKWLIAAAEDETILTYSEVKDRLEQECNFSSMGSSGPRKIGKAVAEPMQAEIRKQDSNAPPLNVLVVRKKDRVPGPGECIREIFSAHFPDEAWLKNEYALEEHPEKWKKIVKQATREVYDYPHWKDLYEKIYGEGLGL